MTPLAVGNMNRRVSRRGEEPIPTFFPRMVKNTRHYSKQHTMNAVLVFPAVFCFAASIYTFVGMVGPEHYDTYHLPWYLVQPGTWYEV